MRTACKGHRSLGKTKVVVNKPTTASLGCCFHTGSWYVEKEGRAKTRPDGDDFCGAGTSLARTLQPTDWQVWQV